MFYFCDNLIVLFLFLNFSTLSLSRSEVQNDNPSQIMKLRQELLVNRNYDRMARPVNDSKTTVIVQLKYIRIYSLNLDIVTGALSTNLGMFITWTDEHLTWNKSVYQGLDEIIMDTNQVWLPTFQAWNSIYSASHFGDIRIGANHPFVRVLSNGTVIFEPKPYITTKCFIDLALYPKDEQHYFILLGSFLEHVPELNVTLEKDYVCKLYSSVYDCQIRDTKQYNKDGYPPFFKIYIDLKRKTAFYFYIIDLPYYSVILLTFCTLFLPLNNSNNFKLKLTTLMFALFIIFFAFSLVFIEIGFHSIRTPYVVKCVMANFVFDSILLILICVINQNIQNPVNPPPAFLSILQQIPLLRSSLITSLTSDQFYASDQVNNNRNKLNQNANEWIALASVLDKIALVGLVGLLVIYHP